MQSLILLNIFVFVFRPSTYWSLFALLLTLASCGIPTLSEGDKKQLIIASDFLDYRDSSLFKAFSEAFNTEIHILGMTTDSIRIKLNKEGFTTRIDLVLLRSSLDFCDFEEEGLLQSIKQAEERPDLPYFLRGANYKWFGLGLDPYVIVQRRNAGTRIKNYADLAELNSWTTSLNEKDALVALFTPLIHRYRAERDDLEKITKSLFDREINQVLTRDSNFLEAPLLTRYAAFGGVNSSQNALDVIFPDQNKGGVLYELRGAAIIRQARNYSSAVAFLNYFAEDRNNEQLNARWNTFPLNGMTGTVFSDQNKRIKFYPVATNALCTYRNEAIRMVQKMRRK